MVSISLLLLSIPKPLWNYYVQEISNQNKEKHQNTVSLTLAQNAHIKMLGH